jgi:hypothetical protein
LSIAGLSCRIAHPFSVEFLKILLRNIRICHGQRYSPIEAFRLGTFASDFDISMLEKFISRKKLTKIQEKLNPPNCAEITKNKGLFYQRCLMSGIRTPDIYAICLNHFWHCNNDSILNSLDEKREFIKVKLPDRFILKPLRGAYGKGIDILKKIDGGFVNSMNCHLSMTDLIRYIESQSTEAFIIQQKIDNHPRIVRLTGIEALQTVRIITFINSNIEVNIVHSHFKTITRPDIVVDTYFEGLTGNVEVPVDIETGILAEGNQIVGTGEGIAKILKHPVTGKSFAGFQLPDWQCACKLVKEASGHFLPIRTVGWDVALTPDGPCIIEGNVWWDAPNEHMRMDKILELITYEQE